MTPWDIVLALGIVLGVFLAGRATGRTAGFLDGFEAGVACEEIRRRTAARRGDKPPTRPV